MTAFGMRSGRRGIGVVALAGGLTLTTGSALAEGFDSDRIAVTSEGEGPDLVLVPGLGASPTVWDDMAARFDGHRVHRVQVRGFAGLSSQANAAGPLLGPIAAEIARYLKAEGAEDAVLVGHSMGGALALMVAAEAEAGGVVVVDAPPALGALFAGPGATAEEVRGVADAMRDGMEAADAAGWAGQAQAFVGGVVTDAAARERVLDAYLASDRDVVTRAFHELLVTDLGPHLPAVEEPVALVYVAPEASGAAPEQMDAFYRHAYAALGDVAFERVGEAAHYVMLDNPDGFAAALGRALDGF
jgi:pimeloyl-ACP methyl ester carboxylesterase